MKVNLSETQKLIIDCLRSCIQVNKEIPNLKTLHYCMAFNISKAKLSVHIEILEELGVILRSVDKRGISTGNDIYLLIE